MQDIQIQRMPSARREELQRKRQQWRERYRARQEAERMEEKIIRLTDAVQRWRDNYFSLLESKQR